MAHLAEGLNREGVEVIVYANGESTVKTELRSIYPRSEWPIKVAENALLREVNHESWAVHGDGACCDITHMQSAQAVTLSRFVKQPVVLTLHGPHNPHLSELFAFYPDVHYVCISDAQCKLETMPKMRIIHHGIDVTQYRLVEEKQQYLSFIGRISPIREFDPAANPRKPRKAAPGYELRNWVWANHGHSFFQSVRAATSSTICCNLSRRRS